MSVSSPTTNSRSPSPRTPDDSDSFDIAQQDFDIHSWYDQSKDTSFRQPSDGSFGMPKPEDDAMLQLDDLIESHAYDDSTSLGVDSSFTRLGMAHLGIPDFASSGPPSAFQTAPSFLPQLPPTTMSVTKPLPPPVTASPRRQDAQAGSHKVVFPPRESCVNLPVMFPSIPENGTKSRVETQVRVTVDLADHSASADPHKYDRVGSWNWLKLPPGTATKRRTRKQGKIDPDPLDVLHLSVSVTCASPPHNPVVSCTSCRAREAKRVAKKLAARVRPARSDSDSGDDPSKRSSKPKEDTSSIIQFNCSEVVDFSTGSVVLPLRITCYCRHHREKVGFHVHFTMMDHTGRIVGAGSSRPIMITDDHKTSTAKQNDINTPFATRDYEWSQLPASGDSPVEARAPSKRKKEQAAKRGKPYDASAKPSRYVDAQSSEPSPAVSQATLPSTRSPTPPSFLPLDPALASQPPPLHFSSFDSESSPDGLITPADINMSSAATDSDFSVPSPESIPLLAPPPPVMIPSHPNPIPYLFFEPSLSASVPSSLPTIHRMVPNCGPTHGGIEVTILGSNFHPTMTLNCIFGDVAASSTQRWSENTLVCVLPPRDSPGVVSVWFDGFPKQEEQNGGPPALFTYSDESDRALMELALQVVGLKMTGKIEEAKNVAMRIVGSAGDSSANGSTNAPNAMQLSNTVVHDLRPLLHSRAGESENFESVMVDFLAVIDTPLEDATSAIATRKALSHASSSGQTLLHLAAFLGFETLVRFLVARGIELDARDRNGYTALHFASVVGHSGIVAALVDAGADLEIVNATGKTAVEIGREGLFEGLLTTPAQIARSREMEDEEEAAWGDDEDDVPVVRRSTARAVPRHRRSRNDLRQRVRAPSPEKDKKDKRILFADFHEPPSFTELLQKTFAQLPGSPQLPNLPHIKGIPAVNWQALPLQIPVLPVMIPYIPALPTIFGQGAVDGKGKFDGVELRRAWERWLVTAGAMKQSEVEPPPQYTPRAEPEASSSKTAEAPSESSSKTVGPSRQFGYNTVEMTEQDMSAYTYTPKSQKKHDRMLLLFWLPILIISLIWACHNGFRFAFSALRGIVRTGMRI
ncbi:hypothetical protein CYLTODRAFT_385171 [Cylindrobasidium torrendii FP15055 ss-10]|uniref:IPT/TIG domain-containing protein n=1 Tax=Cylindrobasidium torrendii FP15055 ss-10 TaxID=1314674 RepID=A0A0D7BV24_9AGAR|nr:hypothetical protein CYLTODRAFT_385171 [Cylindrobasidium torrendii FP15055 ss-10]